MPKLAGMNVTFLAGTVGPGGAERQLVYMLRALKQAGATPQVLYLTPGNFWEGVYGALTISPTYVGQHQSRLLRLARIIRKLRDRPTDLLQSQHFYTNAYVVAAARILGLREVGTLRSDGPFEVRATGPLGGYLCLRGPRMMTANSRNAIHNAVAMGVPPHHLRLLPNVVDTNEFRPQSHPQDNCVRLVAVGRLGKEKRFDRFLRVVAQLQHRSSIPVRGVIVGAGPQRAQLEQLAGRLGLSPGAIEFRGVVTDMTSVYREADVLVLTSDREGSPNVILEAMASGLPIVATKIGGVPEIVQQGLTGYLTDVDDLEAMTAVLLELVDNPSLRNHIGRAGREYVSAHHSLEHLPDLLEDLYEAATA